MDKAGKQYWDQIWGGLPPPDAFNPQGRGARYLRDREFAQLFRVALAGLPANSVVLEAGAADSSILPHFAGLGHSIIGVDYSDIGCKRLRERLGAFSAKVVCCDIFDPPASVLQVADLVISVGLVEHFTDTRSCVSALARFVRPGGRLLTIIPNMQGSVGFVQKLLAPSVYKVHVPLSPWDLRKAHEEAGLTIDQTSYLMAAEFGVVNWHEPGGGRLTTLLRRIAAAGFERMSRVASVVDQHICRLPRGRAFSPYCVVLASVDPPG